MSRFLRFSPGVAPDTAIKDGFVHIVWGQTPMEWVVLTANGDLVHRTQSLVGYFPKTDGTTVVAHDGARYLRWASGQVVESLNTDKPWGNNPVGISSQGVVVHQRHPDICCGSVVTVPGGARPTGIWEVYNDASCKTMDDCNRSEPWAGGYVHHASTGALVVAESDKGGVVGRANGLPFHLWYGEDTRWPRCATNGTLASIVCWDGNGPTVKVWLGTLDELAAMTPPVEPQPPPATPPTDPQPMNHLQTVIDVRAQYGTPLGDENAWKVCNETALRHRSEGWGILSKPTGNNYNGYSRDVIVNATTKEIVDILGDAAGAGTPQWMDIAWDDSYAARWREPIGDVAPPVEPPIDPPDDTLESRVAYLEQVTNHILTHLRAI